MCLQRICWPEYWLMLLWILCLLRAPVTGASEPVRCEKMPAAVLGEDVTLKCYFTPSFDVLQVTWQKLEGSSFKNIATYSKRHGARSIGPLNGRIFLNETSLKASSITLRGVTLEDGTCYKCLFNAFPHGSFGQVICLIVQSISAVKTDLHSNIDTPGLFTAVCSVTGKPAPEITWRPEGALIGQPEMERVLHVNGTETVTSTCNVSESLLRSKTLQALTCAVNHPIGEKEMIVFSIEDYEGTEEKSGIHICPVLCISFTAIVVALIILAQMKRTWNKPKSSSTPQTPAEKKHFNQDGEEKYQQQPTPRSQSISYQNEWQTPGSSQRKRTGLSKSNDNQRGFLVHRSLFQEEEEKHKEGLLNRSYTEETDEENFKNLVDRVKFSC